MIFLFPRWDMLIPWRVNPLKDAPSFQVFDDIYRKLENELFGAPEKAAEKAKTAAFHGGFSKGWLKGLWSIFYYYLRREVVFMLWSCLFQFCSVLFQLFCILSFLFLVFQLLVLVLLLLLSLVLSLLLLAVALVAAGAVFIQFGFFSSIHWVLTTFTFEHIQVAVQAFSQLIRPWCRVECCWSTGIYIAFLICKHYFMGYHLFWRPHLVQPVQSPPKATEEKRDGKHHRAGGVKGCSPRRKIREKLKGGITYKSRHFTHCEVVHW